MTWGFVFFPFLYLESGSGRALFWGREGVRAFPWRPVRGRGAGGGWVGGQGWLWSRRPIPLLGEAVTERFEADHHASKE